MNDNIETVSVTVGAFLVDLYRKHGEAFHGFEATKANTTNTSGYYRTGGLWIEDNAVIDYDGVFELPACVVTALQSQGINSTEFIL
jgi:hypothetical protein